MAVMTYPKVLEMAQELSPEAQLELAEALLYRLGTKPAGDKFHASQVFDGGLLPLLGLSHAELQALADAVVATDRQQRIQVLLNKNRQDSLSPAEEKTLDSLLSEADQVALLKARALYTMKIFAASPDTQA